MRLVFLTGKISNPVQFRSVILPTVVSPPVPCNGRAADVYGIKPERVSILQPHVGVTVQARVKAAFVDPARTAVTACSWRTRRSAGGRAWGWRRKTSWRSWREISTWRRVSSRGWIAMGHDVSPPVSLPIGNAANADVACAFARRHSPIFPLLSATLLSRARPSKEKKGSA